MDRILPKGVIGISHPNEMPDFKSLFASKLERIYRRGCTKLILKVFTFAVGCLVL